MQSNVPAANTAAVLTLAAPTDTARRRVFSSVHWSYSGAPTGGRLTIASSGQSTYDVDITAGGPGYLTFPDNFRGAAGQTVVLTLAAGGAGVSGKINVPADWVE